jgi:hypothetical protein
MKKFEWVPLDDDSIICDLGFCVWEINLYSANIYLNSTLWHQHDTVKGAKIMIENRMREFVNGLIEVEYHAETMLKQQIAKDTLLGMAGIIEAGIIDEN